MYWFGTFLLRHDRIVIYQIQKGKYILGDMIVIIKFFVILFDI